MKEKLRFLGLDVHAETILKARIEATFEKSELEDLYLPYRPKRRTKATIARDRGLESLADCLWAQQPTGQSITDYAATFINSEREVATVEEALEGARHIVYRCRHHVALREEVASQAVGELAGIDLVVLLLGCSNRAQHQWMCRLDLGGMRQQVIVDPAAEDRRLHRHGPRLGQSLHPTIQLVSG
jgi:hypothetical protein